jgi:phosphate transport system permease protein
MPGTDELSEAAGQDARPTDDATPVAARRRRATRNDILCAVLAILAAVVAVLVTRGLFKWESTIGTAFVAYAAFVGTMVVTQVAERRRTSPARAIDSPPNGFDGRRGSAFDDTAESSVLIDLTRPEAAFEEPTEPVPAVVPDEFADRPPSEDRPRRFRSFTRSDFSEIMLAVVAGVAIAAVIRAIWGLTSPTGTALWFYVGFLVVYYALVRDRADGEAALDKIVTVLLWSVGALVIGLLAWMLGFLISKGLDALTPGFFTQDLSKVGPLTPGGGAFHAIVGTLMQVGIATAIVVPIAVLTAVYMHEMKGILSRPVRFITDAMSGLPSIVAGLLVFTIWVDGRGYSGIAGSAALVILMLPTVTRASEEILKTIPNALREASLALGAPQWRVVWKVVLPTARAGLVTAAILGVARAVGETAPMLLTALGSDSTNTNVFKGPQDDLPLFVWKLIRVPNQTQNQRAYTGALILVFLVLVLFLLARFVANRGQRKLGRGR